MSDLPPNGLTALEARDKIREGWITSVELVSACIERINQTEPQLAAWAHFDAAQAMAQAEELDRIRMSGKPLGPLHGVPVGLKDIIDTRDMPTWRGSPVFHNRQPEKDAFLVDRLRDAGAVLMGKTHTTEFAFVHPAQTRNPHNPEHTPGGSSSGSAASVAGYHVPLAIGTQTNGSVIRPASFCGTFGFKPTNGVVSRNGLLRTSQTLDQVGVFGRSLEDVALIADCLAAYDPADPNSYPRPRPAMFAGVRAQVPVEPDFVWIDLPYADRFSPDMIEGMEEVMEALGDRVERIVAPDWFADAIECQRIIHEYEICQNLAETFNTHWDGISDTLKPVIERGRKISESEYLGARAAHEKVEAFFAEFFMDYDAILTPAATGEATAVAEGHTGDPVCCTIWTLAGLPCLNLPLLTGSNNLPVGVQLVGGREEDDRLLRTANWLLNALES